jgi:hypothetical protein
MTADFIICVNPFNLRHLRANNLFVPRGLPACCLCCLLRVALFLVACPPVACCLLRVAIFPFALSRLRPFYPVFHAFGLFFFWEEIIF